MLTGYHTAPLSVRWIVARASMPPVPFPELFAASDLAPDVQTAIDGILAAKRDASERDRTALPLVLSVLFAENESLVPAAEPPKRELETTGTNALDDILRTMTI